MSIVHSTTSRLTNVNTLHITCLTEHTIYYRSSAQVKLAISDFVRTFMQRCLLPLNLVNRRQGFPKSAAKSMLMVAISILGTADSCTMYVLPSHT